jgi:hypothetical protein
MKKTLSLLMFVLFLTSFRASSIYAQKSNQDKSLAEIVKKLEQEPTNKKVQKSLINVYNDAQQLHLQNINDLQFGNDHIYYEKILDDYAILQEMYHTIESVPVANQLVVATNYDAVIAKTKQQAAAENYDQGITFLTAAGRRNKTKAYNAFKTALQFEDNYKDCKSKMQEAWESSHLNILINPIKDSTSIVENVYSVNGNNKRINESFQQYITTDLIEKYAGKYNTTFYTQQNNYSEDTRLDYAVNITLLDIDVPAPTISINSKDVTIQESSSGTAGYTTKYGTVENESETHTATGKIKVTITEISTGKTISSTRLKIYCKWGARTLTSLGDRKALISTGLDPAVIQETKYSVTDNEAILGLVYQKSYPDIQKIIADAISK